MMEEQVKITEEELIVFENLYEKRVALNTLILVSENNKLESSEELYNRFLKEYQKVESDYRKYWDKIAEKYHIMEKEGYYMSLDFSDRSITLKKEVVSD